MRRKGTSLYRPEFKPTGLQVPVKLVIWKGKGENTVLRRREVLGRESCGRRYTGSGTKDTDHWRRKLYKEKKKVINIAPSFICNSPSAVRLHMTRIPRHFVFPLQTFSQTLEKDA